MNTEITKAVAVVGPGAIGTTVAAVPHEVDCAPLLCGRTARDHLTLLEDGRSMIIPGPLLAAASDGSRLRYICSLVCTLFQPTKCSGDRWQGKITARGTATQGERHGYIRNRVSNSWKTCIIKEFFSE